MADDERPIASFFKFILSPRLDLLHLAIPSKFMATHGNDLSNVVFLNTPPGKLWKFKLVTQNGKTLLQEGWPEFVKFYSLNHGHVLVFKYQGNSRFDVFIFDMSASEIEYPLDRQACRESPCKRKTSLIKPTSSKKAKEMYMVADDKLIIAKLRRNGCHFSPKEDKIVRDYAHQCKHPSFVTKIQPSFLDYYMGVPKEFATRYLGKEQLYDSKFRFRTDDDIGKVWEVNIAGEKSHVRFKRGWKDFASENKLKVGDICIFEMISKQEIIVHIRRL